MGVRIHAVYEGNLACRATHEPSGRELITDAPLDNGGQGSSFSPTDLVATALATCIMTILGLVAQRHGISLEGTTVDIEKEMVQHPERRIGTLAAVVTVPAGCCESEEMRQRLENAAIHCPVHKSIHPDIAAPIEFRWL